MQSEKSKLCFELKKIISTSVICIFFLIFLYEIQDLIYAKFIGTNFILHFYGNFGLCDNYFCNFGTFWIFFITYLKFFMLKWALL